MIRVYLDNMVASGLVTGDLSPPEEMRAAKEIKRLHDAGRIEMVTSNVSLQEQGRTKNPAVRAALAEHAGVVSRVTHDHRLLGFSHLDYGPLGYISSPNISDIVDEKLHAALRAAGLADADARHVANAFVNGCGFFVTLDKKDILPIRTAIEAICSPIRIVTPSELLAALPDAMPMDVI